MRAPMYRCEEKVYNQKKRRYYRCNNGIYRYLNNEQLCWSHYNKRVKNSVIIIQRIYRAYRCRRFIKIYKELPDDLQIKIKRKVSNNYYYKLHCNSIYGLLKTRFLTLQIGNLSSTPESVFIEQYFSEIFPLYNLYNKYFDIITTTLNDDMLRDVKILHIMSFSILNKIRLISMTFFYEPSVTTIDTNIYRRLTESIYIINSLSEKYESIL